MLRTALALVCLIPLAGCGPVRVGSGRVITEERTVGDVRTVKLSGVGDLTVAFGENPGIEIETDDNLIPLVETQESGHELTIRVKGTVSPSNGIAYRLTVRKLEDLSVSGSGTVTVVRWADSEGTVSISGSGDVTVSDAAMGTLVAKLSGSGTIAASGTAETAEFHLSGSGTVKAEGLRANEVRVVLSGSGSAEVWAEKELKTKISGSGTVNYLGSPSVKTSVSGSGSVQPAK